MGEISNGRDGKGTRDDKREVGQVFVSYRTKGVKKNEREIAKKGGVNRRAGELRRVRREKTRAGVP